MMTEPTRSCAQQARQINLDTAKHGTFAEIGGGQEQFFQEESLKGEPPVVITEMTLHQLQVDDVIDHCDFLDRVDTLGALGKTVLISSFFRYHRLVMYLSRHTQKTSVCRWAWCGCVTSWTRAFTPTSKAA